MKCLSIQLHPQRDDSFQPDDLIQRLRSLGRYPEIDIDPGGKPYIDLNLFTEDLNKLIQEINREVLNDDPLGAWVKNVAVIVCEGDQGWDNYLLLSHFDKEKMG